MIGDDAGSMVRRPRMAALTRPPRDQACRDAAACSAATALTGQRLTVTLMGGDASCRLGGLGRRCRRRCALGASSRLRLACLGRRGLRLCSTCRFRSSGLFRPRRFCAGRIGAFGDFLECLHPVLEVIAVRAALLLPDLIGSLANAVFVCSHGRILDVRHSKRRDGAARCNCNSPSTGARPALITSLRRLLFNDGKHRPD